jgi:hypothetical protein
MWFTPFGSAYVLKIVPVVSDRKILETHASLGGPKLRQVALIVHGATRYMNPLYGPIVRKCNIQISDRIRHLICA